MAEDLDPDVPDPSDPLDEDGDLTLDDPIAPERPPAWERQPGEPHRAFHAFCHFRDLRVRSQTLAWRQHKKDCDHAPAPTAASPKRWAIWSSEWQWVTRAAAWDADIDRQARDKLIREQVEARERHARLAQATLTAASTPIRAVLEATKDPAYLKAMTSFTQSGTRGALQVLGMVARLATIIPGLVNVERLALGLTTENIEVHEDRDTQDADLANRIVSDPKSTELAIALLDRLAHAGESPALGPGLLGEPPALEASAAPQLPDPAAG